MAVNGAPLPSPLLRSLEGIISATDADQNIAQHAERLLSGIDILGSDAGSSSLRGYLDALTSQTDGQDDAVVGAARLALTVTYMRQKGQTRATDSMTALTEADYSLIESVIYDALTSGLFKPHSTGRSHQGFLSVPLCRLLKPNGDNDETWRLHVWLPSSPKVDPGLAMHSHQSFAQSWILAGETENTLWNAKPTEDPTLATNAVYKLAERYNKTLEPGSEEQKEGSKVVNTGKNVVVEELTRERHHRNESYHVPVDFYHTTGVPSETVLVTILFFDASRGFVEDAGVALGPADGTEFKQYRNPEGIPPDALAHVVRAVRSWEVEVSKALSSAKGNRWSEAIDGFAHAQESFSPYPERGRTIADSKMKDFDGLDRYEEVAQALCSWADYMARGEQLKRGNEDEALKMFEAAKSICSPISHFPMVDQCLEMASDRLSRADA